MSAEVVLTSISFGSLVVAVLALLASRASAQAASRSAAAAERTAETSSRLFQQQLDALRESWVAKIEETIRGNTDSVSPALQGRRLVAVLNSLPKILADEGEHLTKLAYDRARADGGFPALWQLLEGVQGRGPLAGKL